MRAAGEIVADVHARLQEAVRPGVTTNDLDRLAAEAIARYGARSAFLGYVPRGARVAPFPGNICTSVDAVIVHGIPDDQPLAAGQIVAIDVGVELDGFHGDAAATYPVGGVSDEKSQLIDAARTSFFAGMREAYAGRRLGDVSAAIQRHVEGFGFNVVREYGGHGIGRRMHEEPSVLNHGAPGTGILLRPGMTFAVEPMVVAGGPETRQLPGGWIVETADGRPSSHYEHTVLITEAEPELLTRVAVIAG